MRVGISLEGVPHRSRREAVYVRGLLVELPDLLAQPGNEERELVIYGNHAVLTEEFLAQVPYFPVAR